MPPIYDQLSVLAEPTRVRLLRLVEQEELGVGELARIVQLPQSTVSRHLKVLHEGGWIERRRSGTASLFRLAMPVPDGAGPLWEVVRERIEAEGTYADDTDRLASVLATREVDSREFFERLADQWDAVRRGLFGDGFLLPTLLALLPADTVVADLGCGTGGTLVELAPAVARVVGVDREEAMLAVARDRTSGLDNVEVRAGTLEDLPLPDASVDAALCMLVLHHAADLDAVFREIRRALRPDGRLVILDMQAHGIEAWRHQMGHKHLGFAREALEEALGEAGLVLRSWRPLPADPEAAGPALFVGVAAPGSEDAPASTAEAPGW